MIILFNLYMDKHKEYSKVIYQELVSGNLIFNKNNSALYELPKEQRIFFEQKILKRKTS